MLTMRSFIPVTVRQSVTDCIPALYQCDLRPSGNFYIYRKETDYAVITLVIKQRHYLYLCSRPGAVVGMDGQLR